MTNNYLPQTALVEMLLGILSELEPQIPECDGKQKLIDCLKEFEVAVTPSAIYLSEVFQEASSQQIALSVGQAVEILNNAANDIDLNYAADAVRYHVDEFVCSTPNPS